MTSIDINIDPQHVSKFLGMFVLDILHDAKGKGYLFGHLLSNITDLLATSCLLNSGMETEDKELEFYIFVHVYQFFHNLWIDNPSALIDNTLPEPDFNKSTNDFKYWSVFKLGVKIPVRLVADRKDEDTFISLGKNKNSIEAENYKQELCSVPENKIINFASPRKVVPGSRHGITAEYFNKVALVVENIKTKLPNSFISLDMKSAAGLLRTITDPIGYITGLPTYCDPGYNMIGMSAIRDNSYIDCLSGKGEHFVFQVNIPFSPGENRSDGTRGSILDIPFLKSKTILKTDYYYGGNNEELCRENVLVKVLDDYHYSHLPSSSVMATSLNDYLLMCDNKTPQITLTRNNKEMLGVLKACVYNKICDSYSEEVEKNINVLFGLEGKEFDSYLKKMCNIVGVKVKKINQFFRENKNYLIASLLNVYYYSEKGIELDQLLPENFDGDASKGFIYNFFMILEKLNIKHPKNVTPSKKDLDKQFNKSFIDFVASNKDQLLKTNRDYIKIYKDNFSFDEDYDYSTHLTGNLLRSSFGNINKKYLEEYIHSYYPSLAHSLQSLFNKDLFYTFALLDILSLSDTGLDILKDEYQIIVKSNKETIIENAVFNILGKFSGDFGQIAWCIANGHIFASEDNNASALALLLHQLPKSCFYINGFNDPTWGSIHGMGDGGSVHVTIT